MAANVPERWYFTKEQLKDTPSRRCELDEDKELSYRQQAATLIQDMGQRLSVSQLTINTAIVYMHRFYMFHSFSKVHRNVMAPCCLFLAAKVEEQPRKLEHVIRVAHACLHREGPPLDPKSEEYLQQAQDLVENESVLLQTLGFEVTVHHPHTYVVKCIQLVRVPTAVSKHASKDLGQTSYFMATNSLHLTTFCLQYKPSTVACACIHLACKWSNWEIPKSTDNKDWWEYIDPSVTKELLDDIAQQFVHIMEKCPNRLKRKVNSVTIYKGGVPLPPMKGHKSESSSSAATNSTSGSASTATTVHHNNVDGEHNGNHANSTAHMNSFDHTVHKESSSRKEPVREKIKAPTVSLSTTNNSGKGSLSVNVSLPVLPPLTTKYANVSSTASASTREHRATVHLGPPSLSSSSGVSSGVPGKHRHRHPEESPAKKHKSSHSHSSHKSGHRSISSSDGHPATGHSQHGKSSHSSHSSHRSNHSKVPHPHPGQTAHSSSSRSHSHHSQSSQKQPHSSAGHKPHQKHPPHPSLDQKAHSSSSSSSAKKHSSSSSSKLSHLPPPPPLPSSSVQSSMAPLPPPPPQTLPSKHDINMGFSSSSIGLQPFQASTLSPNMFPPGLLTSSSSGTTQNTYMMSNQFSSSGGGSSTLSSHDLSLIFGQQEAPPPPPPQNIGDFPPLPPRSPSPPPPPPPPFPK